MGKFISVMGWNGVFMILLDFKYVFVMVVGGMLFIIFSVEV